VQQGRVREFGRLLATIAPTKPEAAEDGGANAVVEAGSGGAQRAYELLSDAMGGAPDAGGGQGIADAFRTVWHGAKEALRVASFTEMKGRAGKVGAAGLGALLVRVGAETTTRVHLVGHSFGGRLVSFSLTALPSVDASPVRSLTLIQAAFSHWTFTEDQPWGQPGALSRSSDRVRGPLVATFSAHDRAVGSWYPRASLLNHQANQAESEFVRHWGGLGGDGFAEAKPAGPALAIQPAGADYGFMTGVFSSIDASSVIATIQSAFSGAHSDIRHEEVAWAAVAAASVGARP
jgi:pimeloyl-ACP methyl ester carboxylesterase